MADLPRFAKLGVIANYTFWRHIGDSRLSSSWMGEERSWKLFHCKMAWGSGTLVTRLGDIVACVDFVK